jgi:predicted DNA-binding transcriptional regulator AlpA
MTMSKKYLTGPAVAQRYSVTPVTIYRRRLLDPTFPKPITVDGRNYFDEAELDAWDESKKNETGFADCRVRREYA